MVPKNMARLSGLHIGQQAPSSACPKICGMTQTSTAAAELMHRERTGNLSTVTIRWIPLWLPAYTRGGRSNYETRCALKLCLIPMVPSIRPRDGGGGTAIAGHDPASVLWENADHNERTRIAWRHRRR